MADSPEQYGYAPETWERAGVTARDPARAVCGKVLGLVAVTAGFTAVTATRNMTFPKTARAWSRAVTPARSHVSGAYPYCSGESATVAPPTCGPPPSVARPASGHNPHVNEDPPRRDGDEPPPERPSGGGGVGYTGRPSKERPEDGGATRDEDSERTDSPDGREQT